MSASVIRGRSVLWSAALLPLIVVGGLWLLDTRQPLPWPEPQTPWSAHVDALAPAAWTIDRVNAHAALSPDLPAGSVALLVAVALVTFVALTLVEVPLPLALGVAVTAIALRSTWSTASPGLDARPVLVSSLAVLAVVWPGRQWPLAVATATTLMAAPSSAWLVAPALLVSPGTRARRWGAAVALVIAALAVQAWLLHDAWAAIWCLPAGHATRALADVLRPGMIVDVSPWWAVRYMASVVTGDLHLFGVALACVGLITASGTPPLRRGTILAVVVAVTGTAAGLLPPARAAALVLPWGLPWVALGLAFLVARATRGHRLATTAAAVAIVAIALLRHAVVVPTVWHTGTPAIARAVSPAWHGALVAAEEASVTRRLRLVGGATVPADASTLEACVASGRSVYAHGPMVTRVEALGFRTTPQPLQAPVAAILSDLRPGPLVALALSPGTLPFAGPQGVKAIERIGASSAVLGARDAIGLIARNRVGGTLKHGAGGVDVAASGGTELAGLTLLAPVSVSAGNDDADVDRPPERLASSRSAALVILDREQDVALQAAGGAAVGVPFPLESLATWRQVRVEGHPQCQAATQAWTTIAGAQRISVPLTGASTSAPVVVYVVSADLPEPDVHGLPFDPVRRAWTSTTFDRQSPAGAGLLQEALRADGIDDAGPGAERHVTRLVLSPPQPMLAGYASLSAGTRPARWLVRLPNGARRREHVDVCVMPDGPRLLDGHSGQVDDDTVRELAVATLDGWHPAERNRGLRFQWTARPVATATFRLATPIEFVLALDAAGADVGAGAQPITIRVNGHVVRTGWHNAGRLTLPATLLRPGVNVLALEVARTAQPGRDARPLGVLVRQFRLIVPAS